MPLNVLSTPIPFGIRNRFIWIIHSYIIIQIQFIYQFMLTHLTIPATDAVEKNFLLITKFTIILTLIFQKTSINSIKIKFFKNFIF